MNGGNQKVQMRLGARPRPPSQALRTGRRPSHSCFTAFGQSSAELRFQTPTSTAPTSLAKLSLEIAISLPSPDRAGRADPAFQPRRSLHAHAVFVHPIQPRKMPQSAPASTPPFGHLLGRFRLPPSLSHKTMAHTILRLTKLRNRAGLFEPAAGRTSVRPRRPDISQNLHPDWFPPAATPAMDRPRAAASPTLTSLRPDRATLSRFVTSGGFHLDRQSTFAPFTCFCNPLDQTKARQRKGPRGSRPAHYFKPPPPPS